MKLFRKREPEIQNISIKRLAPKFKDWKVDTLFITTSRNCSFCKQFNRKVYSLYGWNQKYPKLPEALLQQKCPVCNTSIGACLYQPGIN